MLTRHFINPTMKMKYLWLHVKALYDLFKSVGCTLLLLQQVLISWSLCVGVILNIWRIVFCHTPLVSSSCISLTAGLWTSIAAVLFWASVCTMHMYYIRILHGSDRRFPCELSKSRFKEIYIAFVQYTNKRERVVFCNVEVVY